MSHPKDSEGNMFMIGDIVVWGRNQQVIGKGIVRKIYSESPNWKGEVSGDTRIGVMPIGNGKTMTTLYKPERALIISRAPV